MEPGEPEAIAIPGEVAGVGGEGQGVEGPEGALGVPRDRDLGAYEGQGRVDGGVAGQAEPVRTTWRSRTPRSTGPVTATCPGWARRSGASPWARRSIFAA